MGTMRASGILLPVFSLPSRWGIGTLGEEAYRFVDFLKAADQRYWQVLPLGPTGYGDSPYQSYSGCAGNPYFIDLDLLCREGLLQESDYVSLNWGDNPSYVDYTALERHRLHVLRLAIKKLLKKDAPEVEEFRQENSSWLDDYALFMALKYHFDGVIWQEWPEEIKTRQKDVLEKYRKQLKEEVDFWTSIQYLFFKQWTKLKSYANENGVEIIGDIPIYVAGDSADAWACPGLFQFDDNLIPTQVAGCPPDFFSADGQLWGNPLYRWDVHQEQGFRWWLDRIAATRKLFDVIRIDHFRGLESYYAIPYGEPTARNGHWEEGPGKAFIQAIKKEFKGIRIIAEDLGFLTPAVKKLQKESGFPGMKILEFAFNPNDNSDYLPHNHIQNCVVYTGTHDNDTCLGWYSAVWRKERNYCRDYLRLTRKEGIHWGIIRAAWQSPADTAITQMQDVLGLGKEARINIPSTVGCNWKWRLTPEQYRSEEAKRLLELTHLCRRGNWKTETDALKKKSKNTRTRKK